MLINVTISMWFVRPGFFLFNTEGNYNDHNNYVFKVFVIFELQLLGESWLVDYSKPVDNILRGCLNYFGFLL